MVNFDPLVFFVIIDVVVSFFCASIEIILWSVCNEKNISVREGNHIEADQTSRKICFRCPRIGSNVVHVRLLTAIGVLSSSTHAVDYAKFVIWDLLSFCIDVLVLFSRSEARRKLVIAFVPRLPHITSFWWNVNDLTSHLACWQAPNLCQTASLGVQF